MGTVPQYTVKPRRRTLLLLAAFLLVLPGVALAQDRAAPSFTCHMCGVEVLDTPNAFDAGGNPLCSKCAAAQPAAAAESVPYDIWTAKHLFGDWGGARTELEDAGVKFSFLLGTMSQINFRGGLNTHNAHETGGKAFYNVELDFDKMVGFEGATFFARVIQTWNTGIGADVGSLTAPYHSVGSSGDRSLEIDKYWYRQRLFDDRLEFRLGMLLNVGDLVDRNAYAGNYLSQFANQAFYYNRTIPARKGIGAFVRVWPTEWLYVQGLVLDPDRDGDLHRHGTSGFETAFHGEDRCATFWEFGANSSFDSPNGTLPGHYRLGLWVDSEVKPVYVSVLNDPRGRSEDVGWYFNFDQMVWKESDDAADKQGVGVFMRYGFAHPEVNLVNHSWTAGASYLGPIPERDKDVLAFGIAQNIMSKTYRHNVDPLADRETIYELYYAIALTPWCTITPDIQVITNPGGLRDARDALVAGLRFKMVF